MKTRIILSLALLAFLGVTVSGCFNSPDVPTPEEMLEKNLQGVDQVQLEKDLKIIDDSLSRWGIIPEIEPHGVRYVVNFQGSGPKPTLRSNLLVNYRGMLLSNKSVFDQGNSFPLSLSNLIIGWQTVLPLINQGSKVTLYIPSGYAYGPYAIPDQTDGSILIPANSNLIFEIDILTVQQ